jgi:DNA-binding protein YbaB
MIERMEATTQRVRELLEAHAKRTDAGATHTAGGVSVTVDSHLRLTRVQIDDASIDASRRAAIENAIVEAVNAAMQQVVKSSSEALSALHSSEEWKAAMSEVFGGGEARYKDAPRKRPGGSGGTSTNQ